MLDKRCSFASRGTAYTREFNATPEVRIIQLLTINLKGILDCAASCLCCCRYERTYTTTSYSTSYGTGVSVHGDGIGYGYGTSTTHTTTTYYS